MIEASQLTLPGVANDRTPWSGAFARYIAVKGDLQMHIPDHVSDEAAATVVAGIATTGAALYKYLDMPLPGDSIRSQEGGKTILIYGGSTATGTLAIQFAKL